VAHKAVLIQLEMKPELIGRCYRCVNLDSAGIQGGQKPLTYHYRWFRKLRYVCHTLPYRSMN
jgi:hypothetical protein